MTKRKKRNFGTAATAALALISLGIITVGETSKEQIVQHSKTLMVIAVIVIVIYMTKIRKQK